MSAPTLVTAVDPYASLSTTDDHAPNGAPILVRTVSCPAGMHVTGGGGEVETPSSPAHNFEASYPITRSGPTTSRTGWTVTVGFNLATADFYDLADAALILPFTITVWALCV